MSDQISHAKGRVAAWVQQIQDAREGKAAADFRADQQSLDRAADIEAIYQEMSWVADMPEPKKKRLGRRIDPQAREQFAKWIMQTYGGLSRQYLGYLHTAHELVPILATQVAGIRPTGEKVLRPLAKLRNQSYEDHQTEVWVEAVKLAEGKAPTPSQVRRAVTEFLDRHKPPIKNTALDPRTKAERLADKEKQLLAEFQALVAEDNPRGKHALNKMINWYKGHQSDLAETQPA